MRRLCAILVLWLVALPVTATPQPVILVFGDSLSAAYGMPVEQGWVHRLQERLRSEGYPHRVVNGSVTGETTAGGLARLPDTLKRHRPALVLVELGGNDGLRGLPLEQLRANLRAITRRSRAAGAKVLLFEMRIPPNYGVAYADGFQRTFAEVARAEKATLVPFFLEAIAADAAHFLEDGIHPTAAAQARLVDAVWRVLAPMLAPTRDASRPPAAARPSPAPAPSAAPSATRPSAPG